MTVFYIILSVVIVALFVAAWKFFPANLTAVAAGALASLIITLPVYPIWTSVAKSDEHTFKEFWNGSEVAANFKTQACERDGSCRNTYQCDPYTVTELETYYDSEGNLKTRTVLVTKYHDCPYSSEETLYTVDTTLGAFNVGSWLMTGAPYRQFTAIPGGQVIAPPAEWTAAQKRIESGFPGGVTKQADYKNYILASDSTLFKQYSERIEELTTYGLLPKPADSIQGLYNANKAYFVNVEGFDAQKIVEDVQYLNAPIGSQLHGDLHVVFVNAKEVGDKTDYANTLKAYWTSKELGRNALSKNSIVVVVGVDEFKADKKEATKYEDSSEISGYDNVEPEPVETDLPEGTPYVEWATMFTGMPVGNEALAVQISSDLRGEAIDDTFVGRPQFNPETGDYIFGEGKLQSIIFGDNKFTRVSMTSSDSDDVGSGFAYLASAWQPSTGTIVGIHVLASILAALALTVGCVLGYKYKDDNDPLRALMSKGH